MRQVGRSVQCRQNRRGRTMAMWPSLIPSAYSWEASLPVEGSKMLTIIQAQTPKHIQQFQELVAEYKAWDIEMSSMFFQGEDGIRDLAVTGVQTCALPI